MKRVTKLIIFVLFLFIISVNKVVAIAPQNGVGGYFIGDGCEEYPNIRVNINNPSSESNLSNAYCVELRVTYTRPWSSTTNFYSCDTYNSLSCVEKAAAYMGILNGGTDFWAAQTILNGRTFYKNKSGSTCSNAISTSELEAAAEEYCTAPTLSRRTITEGQDEIIYLPQVADYTPISYTNGLTVTKNGDYITVHANYSGSGTIYFEKGSDNSIRGFCESTYQDIIVATGYPLVETYMDLTITPAVHEGHLTLTKVDSEDSSIKLQGAKFDVCTNLAMTENCVEKTTGVYGTFTTDDYELPQTIYVREKQAPNKYNITDTSPKDITLTDGNNPLTVTNTKKRGYLSISKIDANHPEMRVAGAQIKVCTNSAMTGNCETLTTRSDGPVTTGTYPLDTVLYYQEISAPDGYKLISGIGNKTISVESSNGENSITIENTKQQKVKIKKVDKDFPATLLSGAEFKVCTNEAMTTGCLPDYLVTGANGETQEIGPYDEGTILWVQEVHAPDDYIIDDVAPQMIEVGRSDIIKSFYDTIMMSSFKLIKKDSVNGSILLAGARYKICTDSDMTENCVEKVTDSNGTFTTDEYRINTNIYYQETEAPTNYQLDSNVYMMKLSSEGVNSKAVTNVLKRGYLKIVKLDDSDDPIEGTVFQIGTNLNGVRGTDWEYFTTDSNGEIPLPDVPVGTTFAYKEVETPRGFINDHVEGVVTIENKLNNNDIDENRVTVHNEYVRGTIKIYKVGKNYNPLKGVQFKIGTNLDGVQGVDYNYYFTDESGEAVAEGLLLNVEGDTVYKVQEVETLPGYELDTKIHELSLNVDYTANSNFASILIVNNTAVQLKEVKIYKLTKGTNQPIPNVKINVYKDDGTLYRETMTDEKGEAQVELEVGNYYFEEVETPAGYKKQNGKVKYFLKGTNYDFSNLSLSDDGTEYVEVVIYNELINVKTGRFNILIPLLIILASAPAVFIYLKKHQKLS